VSCSDENTYDEALVTWESFSDDSQSLVGQVNTHGYQQARGRRDLLFDAVQSKGKVLWNSEYGEGDATGLSLASNLNLDFKWLHNTAWVYWQVLDGGGWGLLQSDEEANANDATAVSATTRHAVSGASGASSSSSSASVGAVNNKYFALAQYTRHFRPGMTIFATSASDTVAAYDTNSQTLAVVSVVYSQARWVTIDLSAFVAVVGVTGGSSNKGGGLEGLPVSRWVTNTGADATQGDLYVLYSDLSVGPNGTFSVYFEANTLMTFEVSGVSI
jgi:galactan endo-1,6-beta-galactosidase